MQTAHINKRTTNSRKAKLLTLCHSEAGDFVYIRLHMLKFFDADIS